MPVAEGNGRYALRERLGAGATASVYRASDIRLGRDVAVKMLHPHLAGDVHVVERFRLEARLTASLDDEHVASAYEFGRWDDTHFMAMEFVAGRSLRSIIRDYGPVSPRTAIGLGGQLLRAARCLHGRGILHRDLKPGNAIVTRGGRLKVIDLGIARGRASDLTASGSILGTAQYAAPEQSLGRRVTAASDLYSIGVILYELLAGTPPFEAESTVAVALMHVREQPKSLAAVRPGIAPALASAVMRALSKDPADRFANADEFIAALDRARSGAARSQATRIHRRNAHAGSARRSGSIRQRRTALAYA